MKRHLVALLVAYAASMTLVAAWLGCRSLVLGQIMMADLQGNPAATVDWRATLIYYGSPQFQAGPVNLAAMLVAGVEGPTLAAGSALISLCCLALAARRRRGPPGPAFEKD